MVVHVVLHAVYLEKSILQHCFERRELVNACPWDNVKSTLGPTILLVLVHGHRHNVLMGGIEKSSPSRAGQSQEDRCRRKLHFRNRSAVDLCKSSHSTFVESE